MLLSEDSLQCHQRQRPRQLPPLMDGFRDVKQCVQPGVSRAVLLSRVPVPQVSVCRDRVSAVCQGQRSACPGRSPQHCGEKLWVGVTPIRVQSFCCGEGAACIRAAHSSRPFPRRLSMSTVMAGFSWLSLCFPESVLPLLSGSAGLVGNTTMQVVQVPLKEEYATPKPSE